MICMVDENLNIITADIDNMYGNMPIELSKIAAEDST